MINDDLYTLAKQMPDRELDRLEADIWRGLEARMQSHRLRRVIASYQVMVMLIALAGSAAFGAAEATSHGSQKRTISYTDANLAPSTLLFGHAP